MYEAGKQISRMTAEIKEFVSGGNTLEKSMLTMHPCVTDSYPVQVLHTRYSSVVPLHTLLRACVSIVEKSVQLGCAKGL